jgi:hypothetical protein
MIITKEKIKKALFADENKPIPFPASMGGSWGIKSPLTATDGRTVKNNRIAEMLSLLINKQANILFSEEFGTYFDTEYCSMLITKGGQRICCSSNWFTVSDTICLLPLVANIIAKNDEVKNKVEDFLFTPNSTLLADCIFLIWKHLSIVDKVVFEEDKTEIFSCREAIRTGKFEKVFDDKLDLYEIKDFANNSANSSKPMHKEIPNFEIEHIWTAEQMKLIPKKSYLDNYVQNDTFDAVSRLMAGDLKEITERMKDITLTNEEIIGENYVNFILCGKPGTGKTTLVKALASEFQLPLYPIACSKNTDEDTFTGKTIVDDGVFKTIETSAMECFKNGGILLLEEFNLADPAVIMGSLGQAIEKPFFIEQNGYKKIYRHPLCIVAATMNVATQGSKEPSEPFTSRLPNTYIMNDPSEKEFIQILVNQGNNVSDSKKVYKIYDMVVEYLKSDAVAEDEIANSLTLRHCAAALKQMRYGSSLENAVKNSIIGGIAIRNNELAEDTYNTIKAIL